MTSVSSPQSKNSSQLALDRLAAVAGLALMALSGLVLTGWLTDSWLLVRVLPEAAPMRFNTAVCFGLIGLSLVGISCGWWRAARCLSSLVASVALLTLSQDLTGWDLGIDNLLWRDHSHLGPNHPGRMALNTAISFLLLSLGLRAVSLPRQDREESLPAASSARLLAGCLAGALALGIGCVSTLGYATGLEATYGWGARIGMAVHTAAAFMLGGGMVCGLAVQRAIRIAPGGRVLLPGWLPLPTALLVVAVTLALSQALYCEQVKFSRREQQARLDHLVLQVRGELDNRRRSFERMANRLQFAGPPTRAQWEADARQYLQHFSDFDRFSWIDSAGQVKWQVARQGNSSRPIQNKPRNQTEMAISFQQLDSKASIICPLLLQGSRAGHLEIDWNSGEFLQLQTRQQRADGYRVSVRQENTEVFAGNPDHGLQDDDLLALQGKLEYSLLRWDVELSRPKLATLGRELQLPVAVFCGGTLFAVSLALAVHAALRARLRSQLAEDMANELQLSHTRFRAIFDQTFQFIGLMSIDGKVLEANRTALAFAGIAEAAVLGKYFWETPWWTHSPELQTQLKDAVARAASGEMIRFEATHPGADGRLSTVDFSLKPVRNEQGEVCLLIPEGRDITTQKQAEEQLRTSEQRMELAIRGSSDGIWDWTIATGEVYFSPRYRQLLGYTELELPDRLDSFEKILHPEDTPAVWAASQANLERGAAYDIRMRLQTKSGEFRWFRSRGDAVRGASGKAVRMAGSMSDVTEQVLAEHDLTRQARLDKLTGLPNRGLLLNRLQKTIERSRDNQVARYALMFLDFQAWP